MPGWSDRKPPIPSTPEFARVRATIDLVKDRLKYLTEAPELVDFFFKDETDDYEADSLIPRKTEPEPRWPVSSGPARAWRDVDFSDEAALEARLRGSGGGSRPESGPDVHADPASPYLRPDRLTGPVRDLAGPRQGVTRPSHRIDIAIRITAGVFPVARTPVIEEGVRGIRVDVPLSCSSSIASLRASSGSSTTTPR
jgi:hypothetical protein